MSLRSDFRLREWEPASMKKARNRNRTKAVLRLADLERAKSAVLNSLPSPESRRSYEFAIRNFVEWYCSEPRLALNRIVVTRYRMQLEQLRQDTAREETLSARIICPLTSQATPKDAMAIASGTK